MKILRVDQSKNFWRVRVADPKRFVRFATKIKPKGIEMVFGFPRKGPSVLQSVRFKKKSYGIREAKAYVRAMGSKRSRKLRKNPVNVQRKKTLIYGNALFVGARRTDGKYAGKRFIHRFKQPGPKIYGLPDGSLLLSRK